MAIIVRVNGNSSGNGFLIAPDGARNFPVPVGLHTDDGSTVAATLQVAGGGAGVAFSQTAIVITPIEKFVNIHATSASPALNDTVLQVMDGVTLRASFTLTAIANPELWFKGRFQARFATDDDFYNHPRGSATGWNFALEGEPDFVPADSVPNPIDKPVGRVVRFNNPVPLRSHVDPIGVNVIAVRATVAGAPHDFTAGDSIIGMPVNLGPNTYLASNNPRNPADPAPAEQSGAGFEPMNLFEFHIGNIFSGKSATLGDRPVAGGLITPLTSQEKTDYGFITQAAFKAARVPLLQTDFNGLSPADQAGTPNGRNLSTRLAHLNGLPTVAPKSTLTVGYDGKEEYNGLVNANVAFSPNDSPVMQYLAAYNSFFFFAKLFTYHSDEQVGNVHGSFTADTSTGIAPWQNGIFNIQEHDTAAFHVLNAAAMIPANIDAALGGAPVNAKAVVTISPDFDRLVVSECVVANPADPPAMWTIVSRGATYIFDFHPESAAFPRDLLYAVLAPNNQRNVRGNCEGDVPVPAPAIGFARVFADAGTWKILFHVGTEGAAGKTIKGQFSGATVLYATGCIPADVELLTPTIDFGSIDQGLAAYREIVLLNRSGANVTITLPDPGAPFGIPGSTSVIIPTGEIGTIGVSFTAGAPGTSGPTPVALTSLPVVATPLNVSFTGTSVAAIPVDVVLVLDRSGSMAEPALAGGGRFVSKSELRNEAAQVFVDLLRDTDRVGFVRFNDAAQPHMALEAAGIPVTGMGRVDAHTALQSVDLNPLGGTSVGDGMTKGNTMLTAPGPMNRKAMVVLTDGVENQPPYINSVVLGGSVRTYAIGLGQPQNINADKLSAITNNTGGYLLVTGDLDTANEFRLHKYFTQILAGITNDSIVVDPRSLISPGQIQRTPFYITEADANFDAVLLDHFPLLRFWIEAPDGTVINGANVAGFGGQYVQGRACRYYRMRLPVFATDQTRAYGKWNLVVQYPGKQVYTGRLAIRARAQAAAAAVEGKKRGIIAGEEFIKGRPYSVLVSAKSSLRLNATIEQRSLLPDSPRRIVAYLTSLGRGVNANVKLVAQVTRPDGVVVIVPLAAKGNGRFEAELVESQRGLYDIVVRASGQTPGNYPLQREQTLSGMIVHPTAGSGSDLPQEIVDTLKDQEKALQDLGKELHNLIAGTGSDTPASSEFKFPPWLWIWLLLVALLLIVIAWELGSH